MPHNTRYELIPCKGGWRIYDHQSKEFVPGMEFKYKGEAKQWLKWASERGKKANTL